MVGRPAAWTRGSLTGKVWQCTLSFLSHHLLSVLGDSQDPELALSWTLAHTHTYTGWDKNSHTDESKQHSSSQCENFCKVSSPESHRCSSWHLSRLWWGGSGGLSGVWGAAEGQTGPQSLDESFLCGTQSIVCAGKGHGDGNTAQSWTLSSDSGLPCVSVSVSVCLCESGRQQVSLSVGDRKRKCVLIYAMCVSKSVWEGERAAGRRTSEVLTISLFRVPSVRAASASKHTTAAQLCVSVKKIYLETVCFFVSGPFISGSLLSKHYLIWQTL